MKMSLISTHSMRLFVLNTTVMIKITSNRNGQVKNVKVLSKHLESDLVVSKKIIKS